MRKFEFNEAIFKAYDVRGRVSPGELTSETAYFIGLCTARTVGTGTICVGWDARSHSQMLAENCIKGILEAGLNAISLGCVPTPVAYFAVPYAGASASIMVTGSHNPPEYNGFKITSATGSLAGHELKSFINMAKEGIKLAETPGKLEVKHIEDEYIRHALKGLNFKEKPLKIGIDGMNGSGGLVLKRLQAVLPFDFRVKNCEMTGDFSRDLPEPSKNSNVEKLKQWLEDENLDYIFAFDGDADRTLLISPEKVWYGDDLTLLLASAILRERPGGKVIFDVKSSIILEEQIPELGGIPIIFKTGHSLIKQKMQEENAVLAGEMSGHIYINDGKFYPFDDGIYAFLRVLEYISQNIRLPHFPETFKTPEVKLKVRRGEFMEAAKKALLALNPSKILEIDGVKAYFGQNAAAFLARPSNTEEIIIARVEAKNEATFLELQALLLKLEEDFRLD